MSGGWQWCRFSVPKKGHKYHSNGPENRLKPQRCTQISCLWFLCMSFVQEICPVCILSSFPICIPSTKTLSVCKEFNVCLSFCIFLFVFQIFVCKRKPDFQWLFSFPRQTRVHPAISVAKGSKRSNFLQTRLTCNQHPVSDPTSPMFAQKPKIKKIVYEVLPTCMQVKSCINRKYSKRLINFKNFYRDEWSIGTRLFIAHIVCNASTHNGLLLRHQAAEM